MSVRIAFLGPSSEKREIDARPLLEREFTTLASMTEWVAVHIPQTEQRLISLWIEGTPNTGATLAATLRPLPSHSNAEPANGVSHNL